MSFPSPGHWEEVQFDQVAQVITGCTPSTKSTSYYGGDIPFIGPADLGTMTPICSSAKMLTQAGAEKARMLPVGAVLVCCIGATIGKVGITGTRLATNQQINALIFDEDRVVPRYGLHFCRTIEFVFRHLSSSTTLPLLPKSRFAEVKIPLPPLAEQKRIAAILDKADAIRKKRKQAIELTEQLLRATFLEMFGDPVTNPKGWDVVELSKLAIKITDGTHKTPKYTASGMRFISAKNIRSNGIDWSDIKYITPEEHAELYKRCNPQREDIVLSKSGSIGTAVKIDVDFEFSLFESAALIKLKPNSISADFLTALLNTDGFRRLYIRSTKGVAVKHLHLNEIRSLPIIIPSLNIQKCFEDVSQRLAHLSNKLHTICLTTEANFLSLQQRAFAGRI